MASSKELPTAFGPVVVTRFVGPGHTRCIQIGDDVRLARADVDALVEDLIAWCDEVDLDETKAAVIARTRECPRCKGTATPGDRVPAWVCRSCGCVFNPASDREVDP